MSSPVAVIRPEMPVGMAEVRRVFGDIRQYIRADGTLRPEWESHELGVADLPVPMFLSWGSPPKPIRSIRCHQKLVPVLEVTLLDIQQEGLWGDLGPFGGCFNYRLIGGSPRLSLHSWGIALDFDPLHNKRGTPVEETKFGGTPEGARIREVFARHGWQWGGTFPTPDAMHWQWARGC